MGVIGDKSSGRRSVVGTLCPQNAALVSVKRNPFIRKTPPSPVAGLKVVPAQVPAFSAPAANIYSGSGSTQYRSGAKQRPTARPNRLNGHYGAIPVNCCSSAPRPARKGRLPSDGPPTCRPMLLIGPKDLHGFFVTNANAEPPPKKHARDDKGGKQAFHPGSGLNMTGRRGGACIRFHACATPGRWKRESRTAPQQRSRPAGR